MTMLPNPFPGFDWPTQEIKINPAKPVAPNAGNNGTLVSVILDESGSMQPNREPTISGFNEFKTSQRSVSGECKLTLTKFSTPLGQERISLMFDSLPIEVVPDLSADNYQPAGNTPLYDAIGRTIDAIDNHLKDLPESDRPSVLCVIMTDGEENSSKKFKLAQIKEMIKEREQKDWMFAYLGAGPEAFKAGTTLGMAPNQSMAYNASNMGGTMKSLSSSTARYRAARASGSSNASILQDGLFNDEERKNSQ